MFGAVGGGIRDRNCLAVARRRGGDEEAGQWLWHSSVSRGQGGGG